MSQQPSSSEPAASREAADSELAGKLKQHFKADLQPNFWRQVLLNLQDPFSHGANGRFKLSSSWVSLGALGLLVLSAFVYFNFVRQ